MHTTSSPRKDHYDIEPRILHDLREKKSLAPPLPSDEAPLASEYNKNFHTEVNCVLFVKTSCLPYLEFSCSRKHLAKPQFPHENLSQSSYIPTSFPKITSVFNAPTDHSPRVFGIVRHPPISLRFTHPPPRTIPSFLTPIAKLYTSPYRIPQPRCEFWPSTSIPQTYPHRELRRTASPRLSADAPSPHLRAVPDHVYDAATSSTTITPHILPISLYPNLSSAAAPI